MQRSGRCLWLLLLVMLCCLGAIGLARLLREVSRAEAFALRFFLAAFARAQAAPLLAVELLADAALCGHHVAFLVHFARVESERAPAATATAVVRGQ